MVLKRQCKRQFQRLRFPILEDYIFFLIHYNIFGVRLQFFSETISD